MEPRLSPKSRAGTPAPQRGPLPVPSVPRSLARGLRTEPPVRTAGRGVRLPPAPPRGPSGPGASGLGLSLWLLREPRPGRSLAHGASPWIISAIRDQGSPSRAARPAALTSEHVVPELLGLQVLQAVQVLLAVVEVVLEGPVTVVAKVTLPHGDPRRELPRPARSERWVRAWRARSAGGRTGARPVPGEEGSQTPGRNHTGRCSEPETPHSGAVVDNAFFFHLIVFFRFCYFFGPATQLGISVPRPGIETAPPALEVRSLNCWTAREAPLLTVLMPNFYPRATGEEAGGHQGVSMLPGGSHLQPGWRTATCPPLDSPPRAPPHLSFPSELCSFHLCSNTTFSVISRDYCIENGRALGWGFPIPCSTLPPLKRRYLLCLLCCFFYGNIHACGLGYFCFVCCCSPQRGA